MVLYSHDKLIILAEIIIYSVLIRFKPCKEKFAYDPVNIDKRAYYIIWGRH